MTRLLFLLLASLTTLYGAGDYNFTVKVTSQTAYKYTIRVPTAKAIQGSGLDISCSGACEIEYLNGGTVPTTGTTAPIPTFPGAAAGTTLLYAGSDSTGGTRVSLRKLFAAGTIPIDWSRILYGSGAQITISVTASPAVDVYINGSFREVR